jgi:hypothetical protein
MLKNESARNATKPVPLRPSRLPDSGGIFTSSNGVRMEKISRSVRKVKQAKKGMTVQSVQSTWHVRTADVAGSVQLTWRLQKVTRGRPYGGHVASPGRDTCQVDLALLAYGWTSTEVTRVTTHRVTRGRLTSSDDVAG